MRRRASGPQRGQTHLDIVGDEPGEARAVALAVRRSQEQHPDAWAALSHCSSYVAYTDGSAPIRNPGGPAGFAAIILGEGGATSPGEPRLDVGGSIPARATEPRTSNNRAEISGILAALEVIRAAAGATTPVGVTVYSDSEYAIRCATGAWKRLKNADLWKRYDEAEAAVRRVAPAGPRFVWVRGHAGNELNEAADVLATRAALGFDDAAYARYRAAQAARDGDAPIASVVAGAPARTGDTRYGASVVVQSLARGPREARGVYALGLPSGRRIVESVGIGAAPSADAAEYQSLVAGLARLLDELRAAGADARGVHVRIESQREVVVRQLGGRYAVKAPTLQPLFASARALLDHFGGFEAVWLPSSEIAARLAGASPA